LLSVAIESLTAARIGALSLRLIESVVSRRSIKSIAGMTVARLGVEREKNNVASLNTCHNMVNIWSR
jgi:hypothetical protein